MKQKITITGKRVHDVGYRPFLIALADDFDIQRFAVKNAIEDGKQIVVARVEADEDQFRDFMDAVRGKRPRKAEVSDIRHEPFEGRVPSIVRTSMLNMNAQLAKGIDAIGMMVEKQVETIEEVRGLRDALAHDTNKRLERMESDMKRVKTKLNIR